MATYKAVLHHRAKKDGTKLILIRITKDSKVAYISTSYHIKEKDWNANKSEVRATSDMHAVYNSGIKKKIRECEEEETKSHLQNRAFTGKQIKAKVKGSGQTFNQVATAYIESKAGRVSPRTIQRYKDHLAIFTAFTGNIRADHITKEIVRKYEPVALDGRSENTVHRGIKTLSEIWNHLCEIGIVTGTNPFKGTTVKAIKADKQRLTVEEIQKIRNATASGLQAIARDVFMLQYYLGGLRISDVLLLKPDSVQSGRIEFSDMKTGRQQSHLVPDQAVEILAKYKSGTGVYILPLLTHTPDHPKFLKQIEAKTSLVNKFLRKLIEKLEINKHVSSHVARHSFADHLRQSNTSLYTISKALGHSSVKMTEKYLEAFDNKAVDDAVTDLFKP